MAPRGRTKSGGGNAVGTALIRQQKQASATGRGAASGGGGDYHRLVSIVDQSDLSELMQAADMAGRDFAAVRGEADVIISSGGSIWGEGGGQSGLAAYSERERLDEEEKNRAILRIPRRPPWTTDMSADEVDANEKQHFFEWRRQLAALEENSKLVLTPFEKNLDVWRQLWRVVERSDLVVTVVDGRHPLFYRCLDLEEYVKETDSRKKLMLLVNKADLLPLDVRKKWARYFSSTGALFAFWSAKVAGPGGDASALTTDQLGDDEDSQARILSREELLQKVEAVAMEVVRDRSKNKEKNNPSLHGRSEGEKQTGGEETQQGPGAVAVVGFVGYPNVGKSSTINALMGEKRTGVTATPGKTRHFQTLIVSPTLTLCDCPGLVFPSFASSRSEMVAAGVLPVDRLTDHRGPIAIVAERAGRRQIEEVYGIQLPLPAVHELVSDRPPTAVEVLRTIARSRGHLTGSGLPDEARVARMILKDFVAGRLLHYDAPPSAATLAAAAADAALNSAGAESVEGDEDEEEEVWEEVSDEDDAEDGDEKPEDADAEEEEEPIQGLAESGGKGGKGIGQELPLHASSTQRGSHDDSSAARIADDDSVDAVDEQQQHERPDDTNVSCDEGLQLREGNISMPIQTPASSSSFNFQRFQDPLNELEDLNSHQTSMNRDKEKSSNKLHKQQKKQRRVKDRSWRVDRKGRAGDGEGDDGYGYAGAVVRPVSHGAARQASVRPEHRHIIG